MFYGFGRRGEVGQTLAEVAPPLAPIGIDKKRGIESDIVAFHAGAGMRESNCVNHLSVRIA